MTQTKSAAKSSDDARLDDALDDTFPASDPVALKAPKREARAASAAKPGLLKKRPELSEEAMPVEKPA